MKYRPNTRTFLNCDDISASNFDWQGKGGEIPSQYRTHCLDNLIIVASEAGAYVTNILPDLELVHHGQCFPLYWYEEKKQTGGLFDDNNDEPSDYVRHDAITEEALKTFRAAYPHVFLGRYKKDGGDELNREDIFYYIYGILHSPEYRTRFEANLKKELPRIPLAEDFAAFSRAGRALANLHLNYESVEPWASVTEEGDSVNPGRTVKMSFGKCAKDGDNPKGQDMSVIKVAENLTLKGIPLEAYDYVVNGRSAIGWLMDRYQVRTDKASGIVNDPNEYSDNPRYIVDLVKRVVTVSMETLEVVHQLPPLNEKPQPANWPLAWKMG